MVTILPPKTNLGSQLGQALGTGLQQTMGQATQQQFQRGQLQKALSGLQQLSNNPNATPFDLATSLISATAGIPGAERYVGQIFPLLLQQVQANKFKDVPQLGGAGQFQSASEIPTQQVANQPQTSSLPIPLPEPANTSYAEATEGIDLGLGPAPRTYTPEQYRQVAETYTQSGLDPAPAINQMRLEDETSRNQLNDLIKGAQTVANISSLRTQRQEQFRNVLRNELPNAKEEDLAVAETIAQKPEFRNIPNDKLRANRVKKEFDLYESSVNNFENSSIRKDYDEREYSRQKQNLGTYAKALVDNGQRDKAERILKENGWGPVEVSEILNPLSKNVKMGMENLPKFKDVLEEVRAFPDDPKFDQEMKTALEKRDKEIDKYKDFISKNFQTGIYDPRTGIKTGTSLLQIRDLAMQNGMSYQEFDNMISELVDSGKIKLDRYQEQELPLLGQHPSSSFSIGEILWRLNPFYIPRK